MAFAETQKLVVKLDLEGNLQAKLGSAARAIQGFDKATSNTQRSLSKFGRNIERGVVIGAGAAAAGIGLVVKAASDYESAFAGVRKTVTATEPQLKELSDQFRQLSKEIPISASELARLGEAGGALGVPTDQLKEFVRVTALLGVTTNLTADEAADSLGVLGNVLHLTGAEYSKFASSLVALGNAGASTERDIVSIAERAGAAGELIGVSTEQILGFSSAVASLGIESEAGGTAIQKFFIDTAKFVSAGGKDLKEIAKVAGTTGKAFQKAFKDDAGAAIQDFLAGLGKLPQAKQLAVLEDLGFNDARITRTLLGLANNTKLVSDQMNVANQAFKENTALTKEAQQRFNTFDSQLQITKNTLTDMAITIGSKLLPKITPLLKRLNEFVGKNQAGIEKFGDNLASGFEKVADALQKVDWTPFIDGLRISGDIAKTVISAFRSLPEDLQKLVIAGFALNKVTGGLGTSIAKDIGGALLNQFASRGSSPANPLWVQQVGLPGGGLPLPGGPGGGGLTGLLKNGLKLALPIGVGIFGIEALGELINATSTPEQQATTQKNIRDAAQRRYGFSLPGNQPVPVKVTNNQLKGPTYLGDAPKFPGREGDEIGQFARVFGTQMSRLLAQLKNAKGDKAIAAAIKEALKTVVTNARGNVENTKNVLAGLKKQLANTHDPKLQAALRGAIKAVERKVTGRAEVQKQLNKADQIFRSNRTNAEKIRDLTAVQKSLGNRSVNATKQVQAKIDAAKRAQVAAEHATQQAVKDKELHVTVNVAPPSITIRQYTSAAAIVNRVGGAPGAYRVTVP